MLLFCVGLYTGLFSANFMYFLFYVGSGIGMCLSLLLYKEFLISEESIYTISVVFFSIAGFLEMRRRKKMK